MCFLHREVKLVHKVGSISSCVLLPCRQPHGFARTPLTSRSTTSSLCFSQQPCPSSYTLLRSLRWHCCPQHGSTCSSSAPRPWRLEAGLSRECLCSDGDQYATCAQSGPDPQARVLRCQVNNLCAATTHVTLLYKLHASRSCGGNVIDSPRNLLASFLTPHTGGLVASFNFLLGRCAKSSRAPPRPLHLLDRLCQAVQ